MTSPFVALREALLDSELAVEMTYIHQITGETTVKALLDVTPMIDNLGQARVTQDNIEVRISADAVTAPLRDDEIRWGDVVYRVAETPVKDRHGLYWVLAGIRLEDVTTWQ